MITSVIKGSVVNSGQLVLGANMSLAADSDGRPVIDAVVGGTVWTADPSTGFWLPDFDDTRSLGSNIRRVRDLYMSRSVFLGGGLVNAVSMRFPVGVAPSVPVDGDMWFTVAGLFVRVNGATVGPLSGATAAPFGDVQGSGFTVRTGFGGTILLSVSSNHVLTTGTSNFYIGAANALRWAVDWSTGGFLPVGDAVLDIGDQFSRVRDLYVARQGKFTASDINRAPINLGQGVSPSNPNNGDVWHTSSGLFVRTNGVSIGPLGTGGGSVPDATTFVKGVLRLSGDLAGTADTPAVAVGAITVSKLSPEVKTMILMRG